MLSMIAPLFSSRILLASLFLCFMPDFTSSLSEQCQSETEILGNNSAVTDLVPYGECNINLDVTDSCSFDFATISSPFENACVEQGGQIYSDSLTFDCKVSAFDRTYNADYYYQNYPACVSTNCSIQEIQEYFDKVVYDAFEQEIAAQGFNCNISGVGSATSGMVFAFGLAMVVATLLVS